MGSRISRTHTVLSKMNPTANLSELPERRKMVPWATALLSADRANPQGQTLFCCQTKLKATRVPQEGLSSVDTLTAKACISFNMALVSQHICIKI